MIKYDYYTGSDRYSYNVIVHRSTVPIGHRTHHFRFFLYAFTVFNKTDLVLAYL
jgi:hypothetical protein